MPSCLLSPGHYVTITWTDYSVLSSRCFCPCGIERNSVFYNQKLQGKTLPGLHQNSEHLQKVRVVLRWHHCTALLTDRSPANVVCCHFLSSTRQNHPKTQVQQQEWKASHSHSGGCDSIKQQQTWEAWAHCAAHCWRGWKWVTIFIRIRLFPLVLD